MIEKLKEYIQQIRGVSYKSTDSVDKPQEGYVPLLRANNINNGKINFENLIYVKKDKVKESQYLKKGDILICTSSGSKELVGKAGLIIKDTNATFGAFCKVIRLKECCNNNYFNYYFQSNYYKSMIQKSSNGVNINNLKAEDFDNLSVNILSYEIQENISNKLDKVQNIIDLRQKQKEELDKLIESQFVEMFGEPLTSNNYGRITLDKIVKVNQGLQIPVSQRFNEDGENRYKYITIQFLNGGKKTEYIENPNARVICTKDDILMTRTGNTGQVITNVEGVFHYNFFKVDYDKKRLHKEFLIKYFENDGIYKDMLRRATTSTIPDLSHSEFYKMSIDLPPIELQNQFAEIVKQINNQKFILEKSLKETEELQESLMNIYFGE